MTENPILTKELRTRMRGAKAFWILFVFLATLSTIVSVVYLSWSHNAAYQQASFNLGRQFFLILFMVQAALVGLITPALTAGALSIEREQRTFDALAVTRLAPRTIVIGKLASALGFVALLLLGSVPLLALCFLLGGVSPGEVFAADLLLLASAFLYGATGLAFSSFARTTASSTVLTYGTILLFFFATLPLTVMNSSAFSGTTAGEIGRACLVAVNPIGALAAGASLERYFGLTVPAWFSALLINGGLGTILTVVAIHRLGQPRGDRSGLLRALTAGFMTLLSFFLFGSLAANNLLGERGVSLGVAGVVLVVFPALLAPLFATGERLPTGSLRAAARRLGDGNPVSGAVFVGLLTAGASLIYLLGSAYGGYPLRADAPLLALASAYLLGSLGIFLSSRLGRWSALALTALGAGVLYTLPLAWTDPTQARGTDTLWNLTPIPAAFSVDMPTSWQSTALAQGHPNAAVTVALYVAAGTVLLLLARRSAR
jgi:ABC-type transport system involved in multi-copper enzyme maturation permease subunit